MDWQLWFVVTVVAVAGVSMASGRLRVDVTAFLVVLALGLGGILTPAEALAGFSDPVVVTIAGLLVVGEALSRTGVASDIGGWVTRLAGTSEPRVMALLMLGAAALGSVMSSTAVVAIFIPVAVSIAHRTGIARSRILMPLAHGVLISGMMTLIATAPNLLVSAELERSGLQPFGFFAFTPIGLAVLAVALLYLLVLGRRLLPAGERVPEPRSAVGMRELVQRYGLAGGIKRLEIPGRSKLVGRSLAEIRLGSDYGVRVLAVEREERFVVRVLGAPGPDTRIRAGDVLLVQDLGQDLARCAEELELDVQPMQDRHRELLIRDVGVAEVLVPPESSLKGSSLRESRFRERHQLEVIGVRRASRVVQAFLDERVRPGDTLLVAGPWARIAQVESDARDFVVLTMPSELEVVAPARRRGPVALSIVAAMVALSALELVPVVFAVLLAAVALVATRCLTMSDAYRAIHWSSVFLIAGMLPVADALERTGGIGAVSRWLAGGVGELGPTVMVAALFGVTAVLGGLLSSAPTAVLMAPVALSVASSMGVAPHAFAMTVAIAASAAYVTPISSPVGTLILEPGGYRYLDFVKVGLPLLLLTWLVAVGLIPLLFPF